jgi:chemotaxis protein MotB
MALARGRRNAPHNYWPGFVDVLSTLLLVVTFLMSLFMVAQYYASQEAMGKDSALARLQQQILDLGLELDLEKKKNKNYSDQIGVLQATLGDLESENKRLQSQLGSGNMGGDASARIAALTSEADKQKQISAQARAQVELLNQQIAALRRQFAALQQALEASEARDKEARARIASLGDRLNVALVQRIQELSRYRSNFFGELKKVLGGRDDIQIVGDRFVFQSEVFFDSGSAEISPAGLASLDKLGVALLQLEKKIPKNINWVLRIDGHTDRRPIATSSFASNWELSSARAISVVKQLIAQGVSADRLVAAGFGEYQPVDNGTSEDALRRNRRIELKLTEK